MKKHIKADNEELNNQLLEKYGIDLKTYKNPDIVQKLGELIVFPKYVIKYVSVPIVISLLLYVFSFFLFSFNTIGLTIYIFLGLVLFILNGVLGGLNYLLFKIKSDIRGLMGFSFEITAKAVNDMSNTGSNLSQNQGAVGELFKGVTLIVIIPSLFDALANQVPFLGGFFNKLIQTSLVGISNKLKFSDSDITKEDSNTNEKKNYVAIIERTQNTSDMILSRVFSSLQLPLKITLFLFSAVLLVLIWLTTS